MGKDKFVQDLEKDEMLDSEQFILVKVQKNVTKTGSQYLRLEFADKTGTITGNVWENNMENCPEDALVENSVINLWGKIEEYKGNKQVKVLSMSKATDYDESNFLAVSSQSVDDLWAKLEKHIESITNANVANFISTIFKKDEIREQFIKHPAAEKVHHAFRHGLLEHVVEILDMADAILPFYPEADISLVKAGAILHDIGKLKELVDHGLSYSRSDSGHLIGHIIQSYDFFNNNIPDDFPEDLKMKIGHIILAHHGILEYGSPVVPKTIEAAIVSQLDGASAQIRIFQKVLSENEGSEDSFSQREFAIGTSVYLK